MLELIDASRIPLRDPRFTCAETDNRVRGLKLYLRQDAASGLPVHYALTSPKVSDTALARKTEIRSGTTYVFDKGFTDYAWWHRLDQAGAVFVTRLKANAYRARRGPAALPSWPQLTQGGSPAAQRRGLYPLYGTERREVLVARDGKPPLRQLTNDHTRPAAEIAALYKRRWQIKLFFK